MAARRKPKPRRTPAGATPKPAPTVEAAPVQTQAAEAAAEALIAAARTKADDITNTALAAASTAVRAANEKHDKLLSAAERAAEALQDKANGEAERLLAEARGEAGRLRAEAEGQAADAQAQAELAAQRTEKSAGARADLLHEQAVRDAEKLATDARERADRIGTMAVAEARRLTEEAKTEADRLLTEARTDAGRAQQIVDEAKADADRITRDAKAEADGELTDARNAALRLQYKARVETEIRERRDDAFDTWSARLVIAGTVGLTASGEYALARMVGFDKPVAWLLPFVIDVYVIQAFRRHRDIVQAIALTVAANVIFHLADKGLFGVEKVARDGNEPKWWLIAMVASVASVILWRMHSITAPPKAEREPGKEQHGQVQSPPEQLPVDAQPERVGRPVEAPVSAPAERAQAPAVERASGRSGGRPRKPKSERAQGAHPKPKKSAPKPIAERRQERVLALYSDLGKRPEWTDIRDALAEAKLADKSISRSSCQRIRDAVEADQPHLAAFGSDNVRSITGGSA